MFVDLVHWSDCDASFSKRCVSLAISCLADDLTKANVDDELVDFTHKGGWDKIDTVLCKHLGFDNILSNMCADYLDSLLTRAGNLEVSTSPLLHREELTLAFCLQKRRPEAGKIIKKYAKRWMRAVYPDYYFNNGYATDSTTQSNDESSDSDSD